MAPFSPQQRARHKKSHEQRGCSFPSVLAAIVNCVHNGNSPLPTGPFLSLSKSRRRQERPRREGDRRQKQHKTTATRRLGRCRTVEGSCRRRNSSCHKLPTIPRQHLLPRTSLCNVSPFWPLFLSFLAFLSLLSPEQPYPFVFFFLTTTSVFFVGSCVFLYFQSLFLFSFFCSLLDTSLDSTIFLPGTSILTSLQRAIVSRRASFFCLTQLPASFSFILLFELASMRCSVAALCLAIGASSTVLASHESSSANGGELPQHHPSPPPP